MTIEKTKIGGRAAAIAVVLVFTLFSGAVHGYLDGRWVANEDLKGIGAKLEDLPEQFGDWKQMSSSDLDPGAAKLLRCYGSQILEFRNSKTDLTVSVALLFGPRGPIAVHTPEVCYSSVGTTQTRSRQVETITTRSMSHKLWSVQFSREPDPDPSLEVWYAWTDGKNWQASKYPRFWLTETLYKIQIAGPVGDESQRPCQEFLQAFLPEVEKVLL